MGWYGLGSIACSGTTVTGTGTKWKDNKLGIGAGQALLIPGSGTVKIYEIKSIDSDTKITLVSSPGTIAAGQAYAIMSFYTDSVPDFARRLSAQLSYYQSQMDGWQQILTGTGDITLTAPDNTTVVVIPSMSKLTKWFADLSSSADGIVATAKKEADRATVEADKAADIVAISESPLPDVWAPLNDSLVMLAGIGENDSITVSGSKIALPTRSISFTRSSTATYINKMGNLTKAEVNEPRFEKEGLLIEGPSTNLMLNSNNATAFVNNAINPRVVNAGDFFGEDSYTYTYSTGTTGVVITNVVNCNLSNIGMDGTLSIFVRKDSTGSIRLRFSKSDSTFKASILYSFKERKFKSIDASITNYSVVNINAEWIRLSATCKDTLALRSNFELFNADGGLVADGTSVIVAGVQYEELPCMSSYIPTTGVNATRAPDLPIMPPGNLTRPYTLSVQGSVYWGEVNKPNSSPRVMYTYNASDPKSGLLDVQNSGSVIVCDIGSNPRIVRVTGKSNNSEIWSIREDATTATVFCGVNKGESIPLNTDMLPGKFTKNVYLGFQQIAGSRHLFGHLRNIRIWHQALSDNQIKVLK